MSDRLFLSGLVFYGYHGVSPQERESGQPFHLDLTMELDLRPAGFSDRLEDTVDYSTVYRVVREVVEGPSRNLLESVAEELAQRILDAFPVVAVTIRLTKPNAPIPGATLAGAGVEVHRRSDGKREAE